MSSGVIFGNGPTRVRQPLFKLARLKHWNPIAIYITSGDGEDDLPDCALVIYAYFWYVRLRLPPIIRPNEKHVFANWDAVTVKRLGRNYYIDYTRRDYGFMFGGDGYVSVYLGRQTDNSSTEQRWSCFLPWTQWRFVRHSYYGLEGEHLWTQRSSEGENARHSFDSQRAAKASVPKRIYRFLDFDGESIEATTTIEEREWLFGVKWCRWLSWFRRPKIRRCLDIEFSKETGPKKGSWKGGTIGHGIDMLPGELHEDAFKRYCAEHKMVFLGRIPS